MLKLIFIILLFLQGCSPSINAYKVIGSDLKKNYNLTRSDLIINYDLAKMDNSHCIYAKDLGPILNDKHYTKDYIKKFKHNFKSPETLKREATSQVRRISSFLLKLDNRYKILSKSDSRYVHNIKKTGHASSREQLSYLDSIISNIPVMLPEYRPIISSHYGNRYHPIKKTKLFHYGTDLVAKKSAKVYAAANGRVIFAGKRKGYGNVVEIAHKDNVRTLYAHLARSTVKKGRMVHRGKEIGVQGSSGSSTGDHLHFEILIDNKHIDPYNFIGDACSC